VSKQLLQTNKMIKQFIKKETVLCVAFVLAILSCFFNPPSAEYISFIDFRTLGLLLSLMAVMKGFQESGLFSYLATGLLKRTKSIRQASAVMIFLCFFSSMIITNDVALITFVPFAIEVLSLSENKKAIIPTVVLQTIAANLGSMLTPVGNPQNLYLYSLSGMGLAELFSLTLPYTLISFIILCISLLFIRNNKNAPISNDTVPERKKLIVYFTLLILCLLTVAQVLHYLLTLVIVLIVILFFERNILKKIDYSLLLTFVGFFIFVGNIGSIDSISDALSKTINGNEVLVSVLSSQIISNVPAAILLSGFTDRFDLLLTGTNLGGLGTLIASMASLISYKYVAAHDSNCKGKYLIMFTFLNILFLAILLIYHYTMGC